MPELGTVLRRLRERARARAAATHRGRRLPRPPSLPDHRSSPGRDRFPDATNLRRNQVELRRRIAARRRELGTPLFDRLTTGAELITAGQVLKGYAQRVLREVENARTAVEEVTGTVRGELSVATVHTANLALIVDVLARFRRKHPGVAVRLQEERSGDVVDSVLSGRVNLGITYLPVGHGAIEATPLYEEELVLVVPEGHPSAGEAVEAGGLADLPLIVPPEGFCLLGGDRPGARPSGSRRSHRGRDLVDRKYLRGRTGRTRGDAPSPYLCRAAGGPSGSEVGPALGCGAASHRGINPPVRPPPLPGHARIPREPRRVNPR